MKTRFHIGQLMNALHQQQAIVVHIQLFWNFTEHDNSI